MRFLLEELGCEYELVKVDMLRGQGMNEAHLARNPNHTVPVLDITYEDGSQQTLIESGTDDPVAGRRLPRRRIGTID